MLGVCMQVGVYGADADVMKTSDWWRSLAYAVLGRTPTRSEDRRKLDALNACALAIYLSAHLAGINKLAQAHGQLRLMFFLVPSPFPCCFGRAIIVLL